MDMRRLGPNGPLVSAVGIGAMSFAGAYGEAPDAECFATMDMAMDLGVDHLDTSNIYGMGKSEAIIGRYFAARGAGARNHFKVATKAGIFRQGERRFNNEAAHLQSELDGSLKRLGVERVDLFYIHRRDPSVEIEALVETLAGFVKAGKIASFGFSEIAPTTLRRAAAIHPVAAVQSEYSLQTRLTELGMTQACAALGTALVAFSPVGRGMLTDRPPTDEKIARMPFLAENPRFKPAALAENTRTTDGFRALAADMGVPAATLAIAWVLSRGRQVIAIPGTRSPEHLRDLAAGAALRLDAEALARIDAVLPVGWAVGARYSDEQQIGPEHYC